ncbi:MAG: TIGR04452 family lipoprotein [Spirochaetales bacterium]|nr:TIGR04452 family lipoprotein [Spirochaetales bacterium]
MKKIGIGVLAVAFMSNCFLTGYLNEGLKPYNTVTGAQAKQIINAAAGSAWTTSLQMYGTSLSTRMFADLTGGYKFTGAADIGDVYEQRALAGAIAAASKTIVDDEYYTVDSLNDCTDNIRNSMIGFGQGRIEEADKVATSCMVEANADIMKVDTSGTTSNHGDFSKFLLGACTDAAGTAIAGGRLCAVCLLNGGAGLLTGLSTASVTAYAASIDTTLNNGRDYISRLSATVRDTCMDFYMAGFVGKLAAYGCGSKFGEERIHEALSTTAFMGAQQCKLKKAGSVIQTDFFSL